MIIQIAYEMTPQYSNKTWKEPWYGNRGDTEIFPKCIATATVPHRIKQYSYFFAKKRLLKSGPLVQIEALFRRFSCAVSIEVYVCHWWFMSQYIYSLNTQTN